MAPEWDLPDKSYWIQSDSAIRWVQIISTQTNAYVTGKWSSTMFCCKTHECIWAHAVIITSVMIDSKWSMTLENYKQNFGSLRYNCEHWNYDREAHNQNIYKYDDNQYIYIYSSPHEACNKLKHLDVIEISFFMAELNMILMNVIMASFFSVRSIHMMTSSNGNVFRVTGPLCGEFTGPGEFPTQRPVTRSLGVSLICAWMKDWVNNREAGDLGRHRGHYDVTVMMGLRMLGLKCRILIVLLRA